MDVRFIATLAACAAATLACAPDAAPALHVAVTGAEPVAAAAAPTTEDRELTLFNTIDAIEREQGKLAEDLITQYRLLGQLYADHDRCADAIAAYTRALQVSQHAHGLYDTKQLELIESLLACYVILDLPRDVERTQQHALLIHETAYGDRDDPRLLPALIHSAHWYEQAGLYANARQAYDRAINLAKKSGGDTDLRQIDPLRGIAHTCRLENQHQEGNRPLDALGERSLRRALKILTDNPAADREQRVDTLRELGDWQQMTGATRDALATYQRAWAERTRPADPLRVATVDPKTSIDATADVASSANALFEKPTPILYRTQIGIALRRPPPPAEKQQLNHYTVDFEYTVSKEGRVTDVRILKSDAPRDLQYHLAENLKRVAHRPRFVNGEPADTPGIRLVQGIWADR